MSILRKLAGQTAIYGLSSILGRIVNYLLVPLYTGVFTLSEFGSYSELYAYIAIFLVVLTMGLETALFQYSQKHPDKNLVFSTSLVSVTTFSSLFLLFILFFAGSLSSLLGYPAHSDWIRYTGFIIVLDVITAIPLARLRINNRPVAFALVNLSSIFCNIGLNLFFLAYCRNEAEHLPAWIKLIYHPEAGIGYIFISNVIASALKLLLLIPLISKIPLRYNSHLANEMLRYGFPLMIAGLGFIINERIDIILLKYFLEGEPEEVKAQVGIYAGCYKLAIFLSLFIQAYRFAAEPFFFSQSGQKDIKRNYAKAMNLFVIICCVAFLCITLYIDFFKLFIRNPDYYVGLKIVPIILVANIFLGIYINMSMWYKLSGQTLYGLWFSLTGAAITLLGNVLLIPVWGYMASAWTTLVAYLVMMVLSYMAGKKYYPIPYNLRKIAFFILTAIIIYLISSLIPIENPWIRAVINTILFAPYLLAIIVIEPVVRNMFLKLARNGNKN